MPIKINWPLKKGDSPPSQAKPSQQRERQQTATETGTTSFLGFAFNRFSLISYCFVGLWAVSGAIAAASNPDWVQWMERHTQALFYQVRVVPPPPKDIVILAIDDYSLNQGKMYAQDPQKLASFEPIQTWPWKREAYATAISRLIAAGAKSVAVDLILESPSAYGEEDDTKLRRVLQQHPGRVTLAAMYEGNDIRAGRTNRLIFPNPVFDVPGVSIGSINFPLEPDGRIHRLSSQFPKLWAKNNPDLAATLYEFVGVPSSFDRMALEASELSYPSPQGENIFYYQPNQAFETISFSDVIDEDNWKTYLQEGDFFRDKIVLIGPTSASLQDIHRTPVSTQMPGVEIHAHAIATLLEGRSIAFAFPQPLPRALLVFFGIFGTGLLLSWRKQWFVCMGGAAGLAALWMGASYLLFTGKGLIIPTAVPVLAVILNGVSCGTIGGLRELARKRQLRQTFKHYASSPIVQEIISQQDDLQDLLDEREQELLASKLGGRYRIVRRLSAGGFGETYIAEDTQRPGNPQCVVKQLRPMSDNPKIWQLARRLFLKEAEMLEKLGTHNRIPQLLAYFEEGQEFYLVEEFVAGIPLSFELTAIGKMSEFQAVALLGDILPVLDFIHTEGVVHRDIKPDNIIRRQADGQLVLIDFGAVKEMRTQLGDRDEQTQLTIAIGTKGYTPKEQAAGSPRLNSDLYALGTIAIQGLTALHPSKLREDPYTGEILWQDGVKISAQLAAIIDKMVRSNFRDRYQSAADVLADLQPLMNALPPELIPMPPQVFPKSTAKDLTEPLDGTDETLAAPGASWRPGLRDDTIPWNPPERQGSDSQGSVNSDQ